MKPLMKGKVSAFAGPVEKVFSPIHVTFTFNSIYDIDTEVIQDKVINIPYTPSLSPTHNCTHNYCNCAEINTTYHGLIARK